MWLVLCSSPDASAIWAYQGLRQLGLAPLELVTAESLAAASQWEHRISSTQSQLRITLADGRVIDSARICGVFNRMHAPSELAMRQAVASDREYAQAEQQAFYLSWLHALPGIVINRPRPMGLCGAWRHSSEWTLRAARAGLRAGVYRQAASDSWDAYNRRNCRGFPPQHPAKSLIVLRGEVFGASVPTAVARACSRLAAEAETELLGIDLAANDCGHWTFANAAPAPDLRPGGLPLLRHLAQVLTGARS